jgi:glutathione S-transferase
VWNIGTMVGVDFSSAPKTKAWLAKLAARPANQRAAQHK